MSSESEILAVLRQKITTYLDQAHLEYHQGEDGHYAIRKGTAVVLIYPVEWKQYTLVQLISPVVQEITRLNPDFAFFLAEQNNKLIFGKFSLDVSSKTVWFEHVLLGDFLDPDEFIVALEMVALTADQYDEHIAVQSGGKRAIDVAKEKSAGEL